MLIFCFVFQNKNQFVCMFFLWLVIEQDIEQIAHDLPVRGHTKSQCDACFGMIKNKLKRSEIRYPRELLTMVDEHSSPSLHGRAWPEGLVTWYDWKSFLRQFFKNRPFAIQSLQHFSYHKNNPGAVIVSSNPPSAHSHQTFVNLSKTAKRVNQEQDLTLKKLIKDPVKYDKLQLNHFILGDFELPAARRDQLQQQYGRGRLPNFDFKAFTSPCYT